MQLAASLAALLTLVAGVSAQSLYGVDASGPFPVAWELTGPPNPGFCNYPDGPLRSAFPAVGGVVCGPLFPIPFPEGDITVNPITDLIYVSDTQHIGRYASNGAFIDSFNPPIPVIGMGIDPFAPLLWITDGAIYGAIVPPPVHACTFPPPGFVVGPFPVPFGAGLFQGPIQDIAFDPNSGSLLACDVTGVVGSFFIGGGVGPYGFFPVVPGPCPNLTPFLTGIAFDHAALVPGTFYVTDGQELAYLIPGGGLAPPTFYTRFNCYTVSTPPLAGLGFAARPLTYGPSSDSSGASPGPTIGSIGQSTVPTPGLTITLSGSVPGATAGLLFSTAGATCPAIPVAGVLLNILPPLTPAVAALPVDPVGNAFFTTPLSPITPIGTSFQLQWLVVAPGPTLQMSNALWLTAALP